MAAQLLMAMVSLKSVFTEHAGEDKQLSKGELKKLLTSGRLFSGFLVIFIIFLRIWIDKRRPPQNNWDVQ